MAPFWVLFEPRIAEVVVTTGTIKCAKLQSSPSTYQHPTFYRPDALHVTQPSVRALKGESITF